MRESLHEHGMSRGFSDDGVENGLDIQRTRDATVVQRDVRERASFHGSTGHPARRNSSVHPVTERLHAGFSAITPPDPRYPTRLEAIGHSVGEEGEEGDSSSSRHPRRDPRRQARDLGPSPRPARVEPGSRGQPSPWPGRISEIAIVRSIKRLVAASIETATAWPTWTGSTSARASARMIPGSLRGSSLTPSALRARSIAVRYANASVRSSPIMSVSVTTPITRPLESPGDVMDTVLEHREEHVLDHHVRSKRDDRQLITSWTGVSELRPVARIRVRRSRSVRIPRPPFLRRGGEIRSRAISAEASLTDVAGGQVTGARRISCPTGASRGSNRPSSRRSIARYDSAAGDSRQGTPTRLRSRTLLWRQGSAR